MMCFRTVFRQFGLERPGVYVLVQAEGQKKPAKQRFLMGVSS